MRHVSNIQPNLLAQNAIPLLTESTSRKELPAAQIEALANAWQILLARGLVWAPVGSDEYLVFENDMADLSPQQLAMGIEKAKNFRERVFTTPKFRELCQISPADFGLPDAKTAMYEFCSAPYPKAKQTYSHEIVYLAGAAVGQQAMEHLMEKDLLPLYEYQYQVLIDRLMKGEVLTMPVPKALPKKHRLADKHVARRNIAKMKECLGM